MKTEDVTLEVSDGSTMQCSVARPESAAQAGVIVLQEAFGVNPHMQDIARRFAKEGYLAIAPELFHRTAPGFQGSYTDFQASLPHMQALTDHGIGLDIQAAFSWLKKEETEKIVAVGFCLGGRAAFLASAILPLQAAVSFYGGRIAETLLSRASELHSPILFFWGGRDKHILPEHHRAVADALTKEKKSFVNVEFADADHGFFCDERASYSAESARQAWALTREFLATYLGE